MSEPVPCRLFCESCTGSHPMPCPIHPGAEGVYRPVATDPRDTVSLDEAHAALEASQLELQASKERIATLESELATYAKASEAFEDWLESRALDATTGEVRAEINRVLTKYQLVLRTVKVEPPAIEGFDAWSAANPAPRALHDLAHGWGGGKALLSGRGMTFGEVLRAYPEATPEALRRMRDTAAHYLEEMRELIDRNDYSEIRHHAGHVEFDARSIGTLVAAHRAVARGEEPDEDDEDGS